MKKNIHMNHTEFRNLRRLVGFTQTQLADLFGITQQAIWRKELPPDNPDHRGIKKLQADALRHLAMNYRPK